MRTRLSILACFVAAVTWTIALLNIHAGSQQQANDYASSEGQFLDESGTGERPIAYPVLETASIQSRLALLTFSSDHGQLRVRAVAAANSLSNSLELLTQFGPQRNGCSLSTLPVPTIGAVVWQNDVYGRKATFKTITTDRKLVVSDDKNRLLWQLSAPPAGYTIGVDTTGVMRFVDRSGRLIWTGKTHQPIRGYSLTGSSGTANLTLGPIEVSASPYGLHVAFLGRGVWSGPTGPDVCVIQINAPNFRRIVAIRVRVDDPPVFLAWEPGVTTSSTISIHHGAVIVIDGLSGHSGTAAVDLGSMVTTHDTRSRHSVDPIDVGPLVTPIAPRYVDGDVLTARYLTSDHTPYADETVAYHVAISAPPSASVTRTLTSRLPGHMSSMAFTYAAPVRRGSTNWAP